MFKYDCLTTNKPFRGLFGEVLRRYGLIKRFKVRFRNLETCKCGEGGKAFFHEMFISFA